MNIINRDNERVFYCVNWEMDLLFKYLSSVVERRGLQTDKNISAFLNKLDQHIVARGNVFFDVFTFFGPSNDKPSLELLFELLGTMIEQIEKNNLQTQELIDELKLFQEKILIPKRKLIPIIPDSIVANSVIDISDDFETFIGSLRGWPSGSATKFKHDINRNLTETDTKYLCESLHYEKIESDALSPNLIEFSVKEARNDINKLFALGDNHCKYLTQKMIDERNKMFWDLIEKHLPSPIVKVYKWDAPDWFSRTYLDNYILMTSNEAIVFELSSFYD